MGGVAVAAPRVDDSGVAPMTAVSRVRAGGRARGRGVSGSGATTASAHQRKKASRVAHPPSRPVGDPVIEPVAASGGGGAIRVDAGAGERRLQTKTTASRLAAVCWYSAGDDGGGANRGRGGCHAIEEPPIGDDAAHSGSLEAGGRRLGGSSSRSGAGVHGILPPLAWGGGNGDQTRKSEVSYGAPASVTEVAVLPRGENSWPTPVPAAGGKGNGHQKRTSEISYGFPARVTDVAAAPAGEIGWRTSVPAAGGGRGASGDCGVSGTRPFQGLGPPTAARTSAVHNGAGGEGGAWRETDTTNLQSRPRSKIPLPH